MNVEIVADIPCLLGEGPVWHPDEKRLYWTDIDGGKLYRFDPATEKTEACYEGPKVGGITVQPDGSLLLFRDKGNICRWADGEVTDTIIERIDQEAALDGGRFNDVIADPQGRVFCGTLSGDGGGRLYRLDTDGKLTKVMHGCTVCNGMGFTPDHQRMYFTDSVISIIWRFDYDQATGGLSNQHVFAKTPEDAGWPDGMTVDREGRVWSARWDGSRIVQLDSSGRDAMKIDLPARRVSSVMFGGDDYGDMYITTAGGDDRAANGAAAGALLRLRGVATGVAEFRSRVVV
jgi:D-xylonolactonase